MFIKLIIQIETRTGTFDWLTVSTFIASFSGHIHGLKAALHMATAIQEILHPCYQSHSLPYIKETHIPL